MSTPTHIRKRSGEVIPFDAGKIEKAIAGASREVGVTSPATVSRLAAHVITRLSQKFSSQIPAVEEIQDTIEEVLIADNWPRTAKAFILYRARRAAAREAEKRELIESLTKRGGKVTLADGTQTDFNARKIVESVSVAASGLKKVNVEAVVNGAMSSLYSGVAIKEIEKAVINAARSRIELHTEYSLLAARLLLQSIYKDVFGQSVYEDMASLPARYRAQLAKYVEFGISDDQLAPELRTFDLGKLSEAIRPERDLLFQYRGIETLRSRYLLRARASQKTFELPQCLWMRVAMGLALAEPAELRTEKAIEFYDMLSELRCVHSTPTLFNSGTVRPQMSSCFLTTVQDDLEDIFGTGITETAMLSKFAGGIGADWTPVRSLGAWIKGTNGQSLGVMPFLKVFNDVSIAVNQGGKRKGAICAYLEAWHGDIEEFLEARKNTGDERRRLHDAHTALWIPDLFMKRVLERGTWTLFSPSDVPHLHDLSGKKFEEAYEAAEKANLPSAKPLEALVLWRKMLTMLYETGHPWICWKDPCNVRSPQDHVGSVKSSNLCTEITLNSDATETAVCNLSSINLARHVVDGKLDEAMLRKTVRTAMRALDNVLDVNLYLNEKTRKANQLHRPVGLGMMGYHEALYKLGIPFDSEAQIEFADRSMEMISYFAIEASSDIAVEKGAYDTFAGSKWDRGLLPIDTVDLLERERGMPIEVPRTRRLDWDTLRETVRRQGMRNSNCMAIAPTATISNISGTTPCTEPMFKNIYMKENVDGSFVVINDALIEALEAANLWSPEIAAKIKFHDGSVQQIAEIPSEIRARFKETFEIDPSFIIRAAAMRAKWIDQSASTNIFLSTTSGKVLSDTYLMAWKMGLKTTYYLRTLAVSQVEKMTTPEGAAAPVAATALGSAASEDAEIAAGATKSPAPELVQPELKACSIDNPDCEACQ